MTCCVGWNQPALATDWERLLGVRAAVLLALEDARQVKKAIRSSLEARVVLTPRGAELTAFLEARQEALAEIFITSGATVGEAADDAISRIENDDVVVSVLPADGGKCERCWRYVPHVSSEPASAGLCERCQEALAEPIHG